MSPQNPITVHGFRGSPYVEKVVYALRHKGLSFDFSEVASPADLKRRNPVTRKMPVIEIDGETLYDSTFILRYLDEQHPAPPLWSSDPAAAAHQRQLEDWCDEALYWYIMALRWQPHNADQAVAQITSALPKPLAGIIGWVIKRRLPRVTAAQGLGRLPYARLVEEVDGILRDLDLQLGDTDYFYATRPGAADFAVYGELVFGLSGSTPEFAEALQHYPRLADYAARMAAYTGYPD